MEEGHTSTNLSTGSTYSRGGARMSLSCSRNQHTHNSGILFTFSRGGHSNNCQRSTEPRVLMNVRSTNR
jgi:hypothetical protein